MICHKCGFLNPSNTNICLKCGAKLITNTNPKFGDLSEFDSNNLVAQLVSRFEDNFSTIFETIEHLEERTKQLETQILELQSGLFTLVDLLAEKKLIKKEKFSHIWENNIILDTAAEEEKEMFLSMKEEMLLIEPKSRKENLELLLNKAEELYKKRKREKAIEELERGATTHKNNYKLYLFLGQVFYRRKDYIKAIEYLFKAYALQPDDYDINLYLGITLNEIEESEKAQDFLLKAIEINPDNYLPFYTLGTIYFFEENYKAAELFLIQALDIEEKAGALFFLGLIYKNTNRKKKAEKCFKKVIELEPDFEDAYYYLGIIYLELNWHKKAKAMFEKVLSLNPSRLELNAFKTGKSYDFEGIQLNEEFRKIAKDCEKLIEEGYGEEGIECYQNLLKEFPENPEIILKLSTVFIDRGETHKGIELASGLLNKKLNENTLLHAYNIIHSGLLIEKRIEEAHKKMREFLKKAKSESSKSMAYTIIAFDLIEMGKIDRAIEYAKKGLNLASRDFRHIALDALGWANYKKGRFKKALELLNESITIEPNNLSTLYHLGMTYLALKKKNEARRVFLKLIELKESDTALITKSEDEE